MRYDGSKWQIFKFPAKLRPAAAALGPQQILALSPKNVWQTFRPNATTGVATLVLLHWNGVPCSGPRSFLARASRLAMRP